MTDQAQPTEGVQIDSLSANEFAVEIDGERASGIFRVSGLTIFQREASVALPLTPFIIAKMVQRDPQLPFNRWLRDSQAAQGDPPTRTLTILALDEGSETRRWTITDAWISAVSYSEFNSGSSELVEELLTIQPGGIDMAWPGA
ncbi:MAG: phage tail protein [Chloroflexi bacterium]|nr:phage tail protein [Chloroflexota bacterium]